MKLGRYIGVFLEGDTEKTHSLMLSVGDRRGVSFTVQWRSWQPNPDGTDPAMLSVRAFVFGSFLGVNPHGFGRLAGRCASNGISLFNLDVIEPASPETPWLLRSARRFPSRRNPTCPVCGHRVGHYESFMPSCWTCSDRRAA